MASSGDGTVGDTIDAAIHRQRVHQRATAGKLFKMLKPTIAALPVLQQVLAIVCLCAILE